MQSNDDILTKIDAAIKTIVDVSQLGSSVLQPQYFNQYVQDAVAQTSIMQDARMIVMDSQVQNIDRVGFGSRILQYVAENTDISSSDAPTFAQNVLTAKEFVAMTGISDNALRRSLGKTGFESTLVSMFATQAGIDWEEQAVYADTGVGALPTSMKQQDGWIARADSDQLLYGGTSGDFEIADDGYMAMMDKMIETYPREYFRNPSQLRFYFGWEEYDGFRNELIGRETGLGDTMILGNQQLTYKGIPIVYAPVMDSAEGVAHVGRAAFLAEPSNLVYGIFEKVTIERDRIPKARRTDFVLGMEVDQDYVNEEAVVIAFPEVNHP